MCIGDSGDIWAKFSLKVQDKLQKYQGANFTLTLHVAIASGDLSTLHLGGVDNQWEFFPSIHTFNKYSPVKLGTCFPKLVVPWRKVIVAKLCYQKKPGIW